MVKRIATSQLETAIALYLKGDDLVSVVTLAGASEEILGKLAVNTGVPSALEETLDRLCGMYEELFKDMPDRKAFAELRTELATSSSIFPDFGFMHRRTPKTR